MKRYAIENYGWIYVRLADDGYAAHNQDGALIRYGYNTTKALIKSLEEEY